MKVTYAITVCNESRDLYSLISFLKKVIDEEDEINILVDTKHVTQNVRMVIEHFKQDVIVHEREFDGNFAEHRNYHLEKCSGDYIFVLDADEMPNEKLIETIKDTAKDTDADLIIIPRINIHSGATREWLKQNNFVTNEVGWINWPDYQTRFFKNKPEIKFGRQLHETIEGAKTYCSMKSMPELSIWHIKSVEKQENRWDKDGHFIVPDNTHIYDKLM